ncbi:ABC transporter permease [Spirochaeta isovalerica]|uniref:Putative ABC transport system permease protein n=1 Tax=Spirochaeta isovalerica TaxID=150 RepID=A0A841RA05_9SPIO|nr:FtsX-like permease family protein [Spirochaeta isovalerica]MBB6480735.1 putative ABC transport system permease protein [Spirochaeta isovalerica]
MAILFVGNALFLGTNSGLERTFVGSFTGDAAIGPESGGAFSLFGNEIPIISNLELIPSLYSHNRLIEAIEQEPAVKAYTSIVSVPVRMEIDGFKKNIPIFGVDPAGYRQVCTDIDVLSGDFDALSQSGVFLNSDLAQEIEDELNRPLKRGEPVSFTIASGNSFRVKKAPYLGIHRYPGNTKVLERVVLADLTTVRYLADYTLGSSISDEATGDGEVDDFNFDSLFSEDMDIEADPLEDFDFDDFEADLADTDVRDTLVETDTGAWSFILMKAVEGKRSALYRKINRIVDDFEGEAEFLSWRRAAGSTALIVFAVQTLFYVGLGFLGLGAVLVIMNALVFSVLERTGEIGTMRSMGASPHFIRALFMWESMIITIGGAVIGIFLGIIAVGIVKGLHIELSNSLLITLFGGTSLTPQITFTSLLGHLVIAVVMGSLAWIYPVSVAMRVQPVSAINKV